MEEQQYIIIGDLHQRWEWLEKLFRKYPKAHYIFLGDYFDDWNDTATEAKKMARWLKPRLGNPKFTFIMGNHDLYYLWPKAVLRGGGFRSEKLHAIQSVLGDRAWEKMVFFTYVQGWLLSHAGIWEKIFPDPRAPSLLKKLEHARVKAHQKGEPAALGRYGITWLKWGELDCYPGVNQIVGHSPAFEPRRKTAFGDRKDPKFKQVEYGIGREGVIIGSFDSNREHYTMSDNWCLDTQNRHIGILKKGKLRVIKNPFAPKVRIAPPRNTPSPETMALLLAMKEHKKSTF